MKESQKFAVAAVIAFWAACGPAERKSEPLRFVHPGTEGLVMSILDARYASWKAASAEDADRSSRLLGRLFQDSSQDAEEAEVILLGYYLGEADDEDLVHDLTKRGRRILPYLRRYRDQRVTFAGKGQLDSLTIPAVDRKESFDTVIEAVEKGEVIGVD